MAGVIQKQIFGRAIEEMEATGRLVTKPVCFQDYVRNHRIKNATTAQYISVDHFERLSPELREAACMVFRLGQSTGSMKTMFGLAKYSNPDEFFFTDEDEFGSNQLLNYLPNASVRSLFAYQLLPKITEKSIVNIAFASGLLADSLGIEFGREQIVPAACQSRFSFDVRPKQNCTTVWNHRNGQVEIDGLFVGRKDGKDSLFVVEAKKGVSFSSLAKHKLAYPLLAIAAKVPLSMPIQCVYLKCIRPNRAKELHVHVAEVDHPDPRTESMSIDSMSIRRSQSYCLHGY